MDFGTWLFFNKKTQKWAAKELGKCPTQISNIVRSGKCRRAATAIAIEELTKGKVSRYDLYPDLARIEKKREQKDALDRRDGEDAGRKIRGVGAGGKIA